MSKVKPYLLALLTLVIAIAFQFCMPMTAYALPHYDREVDYSSSQATWEVLREGDNLVIHNYDKKRTSAIAYRTIGFTLTRCKLNSYNTTTGTAEMINGTASEWIAVPIYEDVILEEPEYVLTTDGVVLDHTKWSFPISSLIQRMRDAGYNEWANECQAAYIDKTMTDNVSLKFDSIMCVCIYDADGTRDELGHYIFAAKREMEGTKCYTNTPPEYALAENQRGPEQLVRAQGWSALTKQKIRYHYNRYFNSDEIGNPPPGDPGSPEIPSYSISHVYDTMNYSPEFNISKAIPSGEDVINRVSASSMNGTISVTTRTEEKTYTLTRKYTEKYQESTSPTYQNVGMAIMAGGDKNLISCPNGGWRYCPDCYAKKINWSQEVDWHTVAVGTGTHSWQYKGDYNLTLTGYVYVGSNKGPYKKLSDGSPSGAWKTRTVKTATYTYKAVATYQVLTDNNIQKLASITVYNGAYPGGSITYSGSDLKKTAVTTEIVSHGSSRASFGTIDGTKEIDITGSTLVVEETKEISKIINKIGSGIQSRNDKIYVNDNGTVIKFMDDTVCTGGTVIDVNNTSLTYNIGTSPASSSCAYGAATGSLDSYVTALKAARNNAERLVTIPIDTQNLDFPTSMTVTYQKLSDGGMVQYSAGKHNFGNGVDSIYGHVMSGGVLSNHNGGDATVIDATHDGYPIRVHTPIVAPIRITYNDFTNAVEATQLVDDKINHGAEYQLLVDRNYYVKWDNELWVSNLFGSGLQGYEDVFDRYVEKKMIRFPFTVVYNGTLYEKTASGFTQWIRVQEPALGMNWDSGLTADDIKNYKSNNHWQVTPFYIPSFAEDCGWAGENRNVEVAVYAKNFTGSSFADSDGTSVNIVRQNSETTQYIATTSRQVQLSGWIYDFSIVGTTNSAMYSGGGLTSSSIFDKNAPFSFAKIKSELKIGPYNRLGTMNIRALLDGTLLPSPLSENQQVPMRSGQSLAFGNMGELWRGQPFAFTLKTMGSLNGNNDSVHITPSFRYLTTSGEILDSKAGEFKIYVVEDDGARMTVKEFDPTDTSLYNAYRLTLNNGMFEQSYYDAGDFATAGGHTVQYGNWADSTAAKENLNNGGTTSISGTEVLGRKASTFNFNHIKIPAKLRLMAGEYEQLQMNDGRYIDRTTGASTLLTYWDTITSGYTPAVEEKFKYSIQQWHSGYMVPLNIYIVDTRTRGGSSFDIQSYIESHSQFSWESDPIVDNGLGKLIIGFDIIAYKNGQPYLQYGGGGRDMWDTEYPDPERIVTIPGPTPTPTPTPAPSPSPTPTPGGPGIPLRKNEVIIVDITKKTSQYLDRGIQNIN